MLPFNWDFYFMLLAFPPFLLPLKYLLLYLKLLYHPTLLNHHPDPGSKWIPTLFPVLKL